MAYESHTFRTDARGSFSDGAQIAHYLERMAFGPRLREIMELRGINQSQLAEALGVKSQAVTQWANGKTEPRGKRLTKIAQALDVLPEELMAPVGTPLVGESARRAVPSKKSSNFAQNSEELAVLAMWREMFEDERGTLLSLVKTFIANRKTTA